MRMGVDVSYSIWLEVQFSNKTVSGINFHDHVDYELKRLKRGDMSNTEMRTRFPDYKKYHCVEDEDFDDINIVMRMSGRELL